MEAVASRPNVSTVKAGPVGFPLLCGVTFTLNLTSSTSVAVLQPKPSTEPPNFSKAAPSCSPDMHMALTLYPPTAKILGMVPSHSKVTGSSTPLNLVHSAPVPPVVISSTKASSLSLLAAGGSRSPPFTAVNFLVSSMKQAAGVSPIDTTWNPYILQGVPTFPSLQRTLLTCFSRGPVNIW